jgi:hypothetical protein
MSELDTTAASTANASAERRSIVPSKYGAKYKKGGSDSLARFINDQCVVDGNFSFDRFFELARKNGVDAAKVNHYEAQVNEKRHGAPGRARMTLRNMLATPARKTGKLVALDGQEVPVEVAPAITPATSGQARSIDEQAQALAVEQGQNRQAAE